MLLQISILFVLYLFFLLTFICAFAALLCCCFFTFFFFYFVTNTRKQLKNNNIKKYRKPRRTCWTEERELLLLFLYFLNHFLFVFLFEFWFCVRDARNNFVSLSPDRSPVSSFRWPFPFSTTLLHAWRSLILFFYFCCCCCFFPFFSLFLFGFCGRTEKKIVYEHTNNASVVGERGASGGE